MSTRELRRAEVLGRVKGQTLRFANKLEIQTLEELVQKLWIFVN